MKRVVPIVLVVLSLGACRKVVENLQRKIRFEGFERIELQGTTGARIVVRVDNASSHSLVLEAAQLEVLYDSMSVARVVLREPVEVPPKTHDSIPSQWRIRITDPLLLYVAARKVQQDDISALAVSFSVDGRVGPAPVRFSQQMVPLSEFLRTFGLSLQDVKNYLKE